MNDPHPAEIPSLEKASDVDWLCLARKLQLLQVFELMEREPWRMNTWFLEYYVITEPEKDLKASREELAHLGDLVTSLLHVFLVDAYGVDPDHPYASRGTEVAEHCAAVTGLEENIPVLADVDWVTPREGLGYTSYKMFWFHTHKVSSPSSPPQV